MKKIYLVSAITIVLGVLFTTKPVWFMFIWGWQILLLPIAAGILLVLVQNEDKSYRFLPKLIAGSILIGFIYPFLVQLVEYFENWHYNLYKSLFWFINPLHSISFYLILTAICIFGGLIGIVIKGVTLLFKENQESKSVLILKKIFGGFFLGIGAIGALVVTVVFLVLVFNPSSPWLKYIMVDFRIIDVVGFFSYYLLLISVLFILATLLIFVTNLGLILLLPLKRYLNKKLFSRLVIYFFIFLAVFLLSSSYLNSKFELKKAEMKNNQTEAHFNIKDFNSIYVSRFVAFDEITIKQGDRFDIVASGSQYDLIGLDFKKNDDNTLSIERSKLETYYNTNTWKVENDNSPFSAGTKYLKIEITMPDIKKIELDGGHLKLDNFKVDNIEIKLNKRFNEIKGDIAVKDTLKLDAAGGVINFTGSAKNLIINSGDCWIEMDKFVTENAIINAKNTSRLNVNVSGNLEIQPNENSGIINHYEPDFGIYLVKNNQLLISQDDIVSYNSETYTFKLTDEAVKRFDSYWRVPISFDTFSTLQLILPAV